MNLSSIYDLVPTETGGEIARRGFIYQDHVGVKCLFDLLVNSQIKEIWFETEDDILFIWEKGDTDLVEFIQVKSNLLSSRWSASRIVSDEILQKSLKRGRCKELVVYRIITSYGVDKSLEVLTYERNSMKRSSEAIKALIEEIHSKHVNIPKNDKGEGVSEWIEKCHWEKYPESPDDLRNNNIRLLENILENKFCILPYDQRDELYQKMLEFVKNASLAGQKKKFQRAEVIDWFDSQLQNFSTPTKGAEGLEAKLADALASADTIMAAKEMRHKFLLENLNHEYVSRSKISVCKDKILELLQKLKLKYDNNVLQNENGMPLTDSEFHLFCNNEVEKYAERQELKSFIAKGCMYDITNRCTHRFSNPKP